MTNINHIAIGCDHAAVELKNKIKDFLTEKNIKITDVGTHGDISVDYPDFGHPVAMLVESKEADLGIVLCGSGNGIAMTVNKHQGIRCALCWTSELASLARQHNDANVISIPARFVDETTALDMVTKFISTDFEGGRHANRVAKIAC